MAGRESWSEWDVARVYRKHPGCSSLQVLFAQKNGRFSGPAISYWTPPQRASAFTHNHPPTPMKTTLLIAILALSPGFALSTSAQDKKPDAPREEQKDHAEREHHQAAEAQAREAIEKKVKAALEEAAKLDEAGKKDAADNLRRAARQMAQAVKAHDRAAGEGRREGEGRKTDGAPHADVANKLKHLEQAIAHLREAGLPEPAEHLSQLANRFRAALHGPDQPRREDAKREEPRREESRREEAKREEPRREEGRREETKREEGRREERRPDNDVEALRREIQELRQAVRQLNEQPKR